MKVKIPQPEFANLLGAMNALVDEAHIEIDSNGLRFKGLDPSHIGMLVIDYPKEVFPDYDVEQPQTFGIRVAEVAKVVKRFGKGENIGLGLTQDSKLIISSGDNKFYHLPLIESSASSSPTPNLSFNAKVEMDKATLESVLSDVQAVAEHLKIEAKSGEAHFSGIGDSGEAMITPSAKVETREDAKATYSLDYISKMVKAIKTDKPVVIEYSSEMPIRLSFEDGRIAFYLAPRVQE